MKRILRIDSAFSNFANKLDDNDNVVIKHKGEADELVTIADMILSIYSTESVKYFGIDKACIWNIDEQKIEKEFKNLPDTNLKKLENCIELRI